MKVCAGTFVSLVAFHVGENGVAWVHIYPEWQDERITFLLPHCEFIIRAPYCTRQEAVFVARMIVEMTQAWPVPDIPNSRGVHVHAPLKLAQEARNKWREYNDMPPLPCELLNNER